MKAAEAAAILKLSVEAVRKACQRGTITAVKESDEWFVTAEEVSRYSEKRIGKPKAHRVKRACRVTFSETVSEFPNMIFVSATPKATRQQYLGDGKHATHNPYFNLYFRESLNSSLCTFRWQSPTPPALQIATTGSPPVRYRILALAACHRSRVFIDTLTITDQTTGECFAPERGLDMSSFQPA